MITFRSLQEALNRPYKWRRGRSTARNWKATFTTPEKYKYEFQAVRVKKRWEVAFSLENPPKDAPSMGVTGTAGAGATKVFATIIQIFEVFVKENKPDSIKFTADKTEGVRTTRAKLYARFATKFARAYGYDLKTQDNVIDIDFLFTKNNFRK